MKEFLKHTVHVERARHKITQAELAQAIGCSRQAIHAIESGKIMPGIYICLKIARYFNLKVQDMFWLVK